MNIPISLARRLFTLLSDVLSTTKPPRDVAQKLKLERAALDILILREESGASEERMRQMQIAVDAALSLHARRIATIAIGKEVNWEHYFRSGFFVQDLMEQKLWSHCENPAHDALYEALHSALKAMEACSIAELDNPDFVTALQKLKVALGVSS